MRSADPNKLYEYAACGRPIVTMKHSEDIEPLRDMIFIADSKESFVESIRVALACGADENKLREFARQRSWRARADEIAALIREAVSRKRA
jgi:glycosyltransferase involved in cell wall biosynthesis